METSSESQSSDPQPAGAFHVWRLPEVIEARLLQSEFKSCFKSLADVRNQRDSPLSDDTQRHLAGIGFGSAPRKAASAFHHAAKDAWQAYWRQGNTAMLELTRRLAIFCYSLA